MAFTLRDAHSGEAEALARLQEDSAVAGFSNVFPPGRYPFPTRGWRLNGETRVVPFPPHPLDVGYTLDF